MPFLNSVHFVSLVLFNYLSEFPKSNEKKLFLTFSPQKSCRLCCNSFEFYFSRAQLGISLVDRIHAMDLQRKQNKCLHMR